MTSDGWINRLYELAARFQGYGITADLAGLSLVELWGLYCYLSHLADG